MSSYAWENYLKISEKVNQAILLAGRQAGSVKIVAVSKKISLPVVSDFIQAASEPVILGENYVQEFIAKISALPKCFETHLIGPLQSNKVKQAVGKFTVIESVHNKKILELIAKQAELQGVQQEVFLQVNISKDPAKQGFLAEEIEKDYAWMQSLKGIKITGLMTITLNYEEPENARPDFVALRKLRDKLDSALKLSMGMTADYEIAIAEGADYVRIGTAIFGTR